MTFIEQVPWARHWAKNFHFSHLSPQIVPEASTVIPSAPRKKQRQRENSGTQAYVGRDGLSLTLSDSSRLQGRIYSSKGVENLEIPVLGRKAGPGEAGTCRKRHRALTLRGLGQWKLGVGASPPTCLVRGDVDDGSPAGLRAQV